MILIYGLTAQAADSPKALVEQGNQAYHKGDYLAAIDRYDQVLTDAPKATRPKFNKANSYYRLDDLDQAVDLYREVASEAKDMTLVEKAKYNLGNCFFQKGIKQRDSNLQQAVTDLEDAIGHWHQTLNINKNNANAARNIEVARLIIKDIIDQINQQKQNDPNQPQDPNQSQNQEQQQQSSQQNQSQDPNQSQDQSADPNQSKDTSQQDQQAQTQPEDQQQDPNQSPESQSAQQNQKSIEQDMNAQAILDKEQRQKQERQRRQRAAYQKVDKDW